MLAVGTEALVGLTLNKMATAATVVTLAEADLVGSATLVAFTVTIGGEGTLTGATYSPLTEIVPHVAPVQPAPLTVQVTAVFEVPVKVPTNCWVFPTITVALFGLTVIVTSSVPLLAEAAPPPGKPAHPDCVSDANRSVRKSKRPNR